MTDNLPRSELGPYRLEKLLGRGGMGVVYRAVDTRLGRRVAVKHLPPAAAGDETRRRRFRLEAATLARLSHPCIVQIFDLVEEGDGDWIVMEMVEGPTLAELLERGPLPLPQVLDIGRQVAEGLEEAHSQGVLHRDLKAENVMLKRPPEQWRPDLGQIRILDFGLAKVLQQEADHLSLSGQILGTPRSMSPEQVRGLPLDERSDLFSLGLLLYQMATGKSPFGGSGDFDTLQRITSHPHLPLIERRTETPPRLSALVDRLLEKSPADRPSSAREVVGELAQIAARQADSPAPEGVTRVEGDSADDVATLTNWTAPPLAAARGRQPRWPPSRRTALFALGSALVLALAGGIYLWAPRGEGNGVQAPTSSGPAAEPDAPALFQDGMAWLERPDKSGHLERAIASFEGALALDASSAAAHAGLALAYRRQYVESRDPARLEQALAVAERAVRLDAHLALARVALGTIYTYAGRDEDALRELGVALQLEPGNVEAFRGLGEAHRRQGRFGDAIAAFQKAVGLAPRDHSLHDQLGQLYYRTAHYAEAAAEIRESLALAPDRAEGYRDLAAVRYMQGELTEAAEMLQKALAIRPDHSLYSNLGTILFAQGLYAPAAEAFEKALQHGGANFYLYWANLADAERQRVGREKEARAGYDQAISLLRLELEKEKGKESVYLRSRLALYRAKRGDCAEILGDLAEIARLAANQAEDRYRIAVAWEVCGKRKAALEALAAALEAGYPAAQLRADPELFALRSDPGYRRALGETR